MGLKSIVEAIGENKARKILRFARDSYSFRNTHYTFLTNLKAAVGKPLTDITDDEINAYFGVILPQDALDSVRLSLAVGESFLTITVPLVDTLPVNDVG